MKKTSSAKPQSQQHSTGDEDYDRIMALLGMEEELESSESDGIEEEPIKFTRKPTYLQQ